MRRRPRSRPADLDFTMGPLSRCTSISQRFEFNSESDPTLRDIVTRVWGKEFSILSFVEASIDCSSARFVWCAFTCEPFGDN